MFMFKLKSQFEPAGDQPKAIEKIVDGLKKGLRYQTLLGVTGSGKTFTMAKVIERIGKPTLVIAPNKTLAAQLYREYKDFFPENKVCYFVSYYDYYQPEAYLPISDTYIQKEALINDEIDKLRHEATSALVSRRDVIVVASVSCIYNLGVPGKYLESGLVLRKDKPITRGDLIKQFVKLYFERNNLELNRGQFRVRGDIFEFMPSSEGEIYKVVLENQKVEKIAIIERASRKEKQCLEEVTIFPTKHFITPPDEREKAIKNIREELKEKLAYFRKKGLLLELERLEKRTRQDLEMIKRLGYCHGIENYSRHLSGKLAGEPPDTLLSYFASPAGRQGKSDEFLTIIDESHIAIPQIGGMYEGDRSRKMVLIEHGWRLPSALDNRPLNFKEFEERVGQVVFTSATPGGFEKTNSSVVIEQIIRPTGLVDPKIILRPVYDKAKNRSQIDDLLSEIEKAVSLKDRVIVTTLTKKTAEELSSFLVKKKIKSRYVHSDIKTLERVEILTDFRKGSDKGGFDVLVGVNLLREGLDLPEVAIVAILDADREGFLRNETSLIQTIGRAARNVKGAVILYADTMTGSLTRAIRETERRRKTQTAYNKKHGIVPKTIRKDIVPFMDIKSI
ncbi:MAG: excinuclease ABC subunit UvrB [bacterium]|nr:excinuclease ABC subunit UvrB [bacterium]